MTTISSHLPTASGHTGHRLRIRSFLCFALSSLKPPRPTITLFLVFQGSVSQEASCFTAIRTLMFERSALKYRHYRRLTQLSDRPYCRRCDRTFKNDSSKRQHLENSRRHNQCDICSYDGPEWDSLLEHYNQTGHQVVCWGCDDGEGLPWDPNSHAYLRHLERHNVCEECHGHFETQNNLNQVCNYQTCTVTLI